ncbi:site-specific integrase [Vibrio fluvialis]|nr:site-specific integrase [Vibrio fluvialis]
MRDYIKYEKLQGTPPSQLTTEQQTFIEKLKLPIVMEIPSNSDFDDRFVTTKEDEWRFQRIGTSFYYNFTNLDVHLKYLIKYIVIKYTESHVRPPDNKGFRDIRNLLVGLVINSDMLLEKLNYLAGENNKIEQYYLLKWISKCLFRVGFPGFNLEKYEDIEFIKTPPGSNNFLKYEDIENTFPSHLKNQIVRKLAEFSTKEALLKLSPEECRNLSILGLSYSTGLRSSQFSMLRGDSIRLVAQRSSTGLRRYELTMPLAKQQRITGDLPRVSIPLEVGLLLEKYKDVCNIRNGEQLFKRTGEDLSISLHQSLNKALWFIQSDDFKQRHRANTVLLPIMTLYDFRHNVGHSMAMRGASAEEIAHTLGHSSTVAAKHYIMATPEIAILKHKALGSNPIWQQMLGLILTGYAVDEENWHGITVSNCIGGSLVIKVGGCERTEKQCHLSKVRSCYGCFYFRPFKNLNKHQQVYDLMTKEMLDQIDISYSTGCQNSPLIDIATNTRHEVKMVINRISSGLL